MSRCALLVIVLALVPRGAVADDDDGPEARAQLPIRLDDLIETAVRLSPDLMRARIDRSAAAAAADGERRAQAWIVSSDVQYSRSGIADHVEAPPFSVVATDQVAATLGVGRALPTGGSVSIQAEAEHSTQEYNVVDTLQQQSMQTAQPAMPQLEFRDLDRTSLRLSVKQPLARGLGPDVALASEHKADLARAKATVEAQLAAEELVRDIVTGYWELAYAAFEVDVQKQAVALAQQQAQLTHEQIRGGAAATTALDDVNYTIAVRQEALLRAQLTLEKQSLDLRRKAGLEIGRRDIVMKPGEPFEIGDDMFTADDVLARSHVANRKLASAALERKLADIDVQVADDQTKPQVDLALSGALIGQGEGTGPALGGLSAGDGFEVTAGVSVSFEVSGAARRSRDAAAAKRHRLDIDRTDLERQLDTEVVVAVQGVTAGRTRVALADKAIEVAENSVRAERAAFMAGRTTTFQVMQKQNELIDARLRRGRAVADYHQAVAQLHFLSGDLLARHGVAVRQREEP